MAGRPDNTSPQISYPTVGRSWGTDKVRRLRACTQKSWHTELRLLLDERMNTFVTYRDRCRILWPRDFVVGFPLKVQVSPETAQRPPLYGSFVGRQDSAHCIHASKNFATVNEGALEISHYEETTEFCSISCQGYLSGGVGPLTPFAHFRTREMIQCCNIFCKIKLIINEVTKKQTFTLPKTLARKLRLVSPLDRQNNLDAHVIALVHQLAINQNLISANAVALRVCRVRRRRDLNFSPLAVRGHELAVRGQLHEAGVDTLVLDTTFPLDEWRSWES